MQIENNILKYYLQYVYFITGTAYAGKSTAAKMLAEKYSMILCGENYHAEVADRVADPAVQPDLCYMKQLESWADFVTRPPEEYERWIYGVSAEAAGFEVAALLSLPRDRKIIVDTNIPLALLKEISDYRRVAVMLSPQSMSVDRFFDRDDPEKQFLLSVIRSCADPDAVMANYRAGLARVNSPAHYAAYAESGFFTLVRENDGADTREAACTALAGHFGLTD